MADQEDKEGGGIQRIIVNGNLVEGFFFCLRASGLGGENFWCWEKLEGSVGAILRIGFLCLEG